MLIGLRLTINEEIYNKGILNGIIINEKIPFEFNKIRFLIVFGILILFYLFKKEKIFNENYSSTNFKQEVVLLCILMLFFMITLWINQNATYKSEENIYNVDFLNSILEGKTYLQKEPSEEFLQLENPYDDLQRANLTRGKDYEWDTAYYKGKLYIYFGILPLLITFLPYYLITKKYLAMSIVVYLFSIGVFILLKEILIKIINRYFKDIPFKFVIYFLIILCSGTLILYINGVARVYELVIIAGLFFVLLGIYFILKSIEKNEKKYINIFLGCLCLALSVACRPTDLLVSIVILPYLVKLLIVNIKNFTQDKKSLIKLIFSVGIPYISVGILLMWYNYIRFENPFEFGAKYQLTIVNIGKLGSRFFAIPTGIVANLFSIPNFIPDFPFITNHNKLLEFYGYYYIENMIGGLFILSPICFMNFMIIRANKKTDNNELKVIINVMLCVAIFIAIVSIMMAGSNQRYLVDYAWIFILSGIIIFMILYNSLKTDEAKNIVKKFLCIISIFTLLFGIISGIISEKSYFSINSPREFLKTKYTICFWE